jgi:peroxiredoxin
MTLKPRGGVPALSLPLAGGGHFDLLSRRPRAFAMLVFYRGLHCPICRTYLRDLDRRIGEFGKAGVEAVAISTDDRPRAERSKTEWGLERLPVAYGLSIDEARGWGLFISAARDEDEPPLFAEPGLFLIGPDGTLYASSVQSMPFARPTFPEILQAVAFVTREKYLAPGEA